MNDAKDKKTLPLFLFEELKKKFPMGTEIHPYDSQIGDYMRELLSKHDTSIALDVWTDNILLLTILHFSISGINGGDCYYCFRFKIGDEIGKSNIIKEVSLVWECKYEQRLSLLGEPIMEKSKTKDSLMRDNSQSIKTFKIFMDDSE